MGVRRSGLAGASLLMCAVFAGGAGSASAEPWQVTDYGLHGYVRQYISLNLQDQPETVGYDDKYKLSMVRTQLRLDPRLTLGPIRFFGQVRAVKEVTTGYLQKLQDMNNAGNLNPENILDRYDTLDLREFYGEFDLGSRTTIRLGKQQVVWGESDFFAANDQVQGFDYTWRSFLEPENEEVRKPLVIANAVIQVPEADGSLQVYVRPGLDRKKDIGTTYDLFGGRWANQPNKGVDFFSLTSSGPLTQYNLDQSGAKQSEVTYGARWQGTLGEVSYSLMYLKSHNQDPVLNPSALLSNTGYKGHLSTAVLGDLIYPIVNTVGGTASYYVPMADAVFSTEVAYTFDKPYNFGLNDQPSTGLAAGTPYGYLLAGGGGVILKDTVRAMLRMDKTLDLQNLLWTSKPSFFSVQLFDTWIPQFKSSDSIVYLVGYGLPRKEHSALATAILNLNYDNDKVLPGLVAGWDVSYGGGFLVPSVEFPIGNDIRLKAEADIFFTQGSSKYPGQIESNTGLFGYFSHNNQLMVRATYQF